MSRKGLFIDYEFCTGCHSCEIACQMEHGFPVGQFGIQVASIGPWQYGEKSWQYAFMPIPTDQCDLCAERVSYDKLPTCVHHCQANVMKYGNVEDFMTDLLAKPKTVVFSLQ